MKPFEQYISESIAVGDLANDYKWVILAKRENLDLANMTQEEFVRLMEEDIKQATAEFERIRIPQRAADKEWRMKREMERAEKYALKKWKTEKKQQEYLSQFKTNLETSYANYGKKPEELLFEFDPEPGPKLSGPSVIHPKYLDSDLVRCFNEVTRSKWWKQGTGWVFKYIKSQTGFCNFNAQIDLILPESAAATRRREKDELERAIGDYYDSVGSGGWTGD